MPVTEYTILLSSIVAGITISPEYSGIEDVTSTVNGSVADVIL